MDLKALFRKIPLSLRLDLWTLAVLLLAPAFAMLLERPWLPGLASAPLERWAFCLLVYALLSPLSLVGISLLLFWAVCCWSRIPSWRSALTLLLWTVLVHCFPQIYFLCYRHLPSLAGMS